MSTPKVMETPGDPRKTGYAWQPRPDGSLIMVGQPLPPNRPGDYLGSVMTRIKQ